MKIITNKYKKIALIECRCCREDHTVELIQDEDTLYFTFKSSRFTKIDNLKSRLYFLKNYKEFIKGGSKVGFHGIIMSIDQVKELIQVMEENYPNTQYSEASDWINPKIVIPIVYVDKFRNLKETKSDDYEMILFNSDELTLSTDVIHGCKNIVDDISFSYHLPPDTTFKTALRISNFYNAEYEASLELTEVPQFIATLKAIVKLAEEEAERLIDQK
jgi:ASC-1-like (ASCH) protein